MQRPVAKPGTISTPTPTPAVLASAQAIRERATRLGRWRAARRAGADAAARHRFLAALYLLRANAHRLAATTRPVPGKPADPRVHQAVAGVWQALRAATPTARPSREGEGFDGEGDPASAPPSSGSRSTRRPARPRTTMRPVAPAWPTPIDAPIATQGIPPTLRSPGNDAKPLTRRDGAAARAQDALRTDFPELFEGDPFDPKRARRNSREKIRVERTRTDRAQQRTKGREDVRRQRKAAIDQLRRAAPSAFRRALQRTPLATAPVGVLDQVALLAASDFAQMAWGLFSQNDGGTPIHTAAIAALISTAIVRAGTRIGVLDKINAPQVAQAVYAILSAEMPMALKLLATAAVVAGTGKPRRESEGEVDWEAFG